MNRDSIVVGAFDPISGKVIDVPTHQAVNEKVRLSHDINPDAETTKEVGNSDIKDVSVLEEDGEESDKDKNSEDKIIITGADAAEYLLSLRDDFEPALTFRAIFLASGLACFQAVMSQIYSFKPTLVVISGTFIVLIAYFLGRAWAKFLPRGDRLESKWRAKGNTGDVPFWIKTVSFFNHGPWNLKEHSVCAITATSASNGAASVTVYAAQNLFYDLPLSATTVILGTISIGLFGYGLAGVMRPMAVWHVDAVYWSTLPTVKVLQGLHWQEIKSSKPIRYFWYAFGSMFAYEWFPAYIFPWLNSVSVPCLASMKATGDKADVLTTIFGGAYSNEGVGLLSVSFDWQYITSFQTSLPLKLQAHQASGLIVCVAVMLALYYGDAWGSRSLPFMSTKLLSEDGSKYPITTVFEGGVLNKTALAENGIPVLSGTFAYAMFMANAAIGALVVHCIAFWGGDVKRAFISARKAGSGDVHHQHMEKHYKETPWWWYVSVLVFSFVLGLVVVIKENITLPAWGYIVSLILGIFIAPFSTLLYSRYGNGIATNNLSKMLAGLLLPGRPVGNMYFAAWSHNVIGNAVTLCNDLKMGEYLKIAPRVMFGTQIYGTILGAFINYAVMISIVDSNRALLVDGNGNSSWSGAQIQAYNTNATSWALARYLYSTGSKYEVVPLGLVVGGGLVAIHRVICAFVPRIKGFSLYEINLPQFIQYAGYIPYNSPQTCILLSQCLAGFFVQFYLRNYRPVIFKDYSYLVTGAWDGASLCVAFILSFAVFGAGGPSIPFPQWWGNNQAGYPDLCPTGE